MTASTTGLGAHEVFTLSLNEATGAWTFTLINPIDQQAGHGANSQTIDLSGLVQAVDFDGDTVTLSGDFSVSVKDDVPVLVSKASATGTVDEGGLTQVSSGFDHDHDRGTDLYGNGNDRGAPTAVSGTLFGLVSFGADGPDGKGGASITGGDTGAFQFVSSSAASSWLTHLDLTSHGSAIDAATISISNGIETLTASTTGLGAHEVFTLSLNEATGAWTFTLINPIDQQAGHGANSQTIDLSGLVQAVDFDGDTVTLSGDFSVSVKDDVPVLVSKASATGTVDEGGLTQVSSGFDHDHDRGTDLYGNGNDRGAPTAVSGTLFGLVSFGADGPDGKGGASITGGDTGAFQFVSQAKADTWLQGLDLTSHGLSVDAATISISNGIETLTASTTGLGAHEVFTLSLNEATGDWTFTLINPIDQQAGHGANSQTIDLSGLVQAVDFDGDTVTLSGDFSVSVKDDVPVLTGLSVTGTVFEAGLTSGTDSYGSGTQAGHQADPVSKTGLLASLVSFGADGPDGKGGASITGGDTGAFQFVSSSAASSWLTHLDLTSHGSAIDAATISISNGIETLTASTTGLGAHEVFTLSLNEATGAWTFTLINPIDQQAGHGANSQTIDLSGLVQAVDFDGDTVTLSGDFSVSVKDDVPVLVSKASATGTVDEGGLTQVSSGFDHDHDRGTDLYGNGNDRGAPTAVSGTLFGLVSFGADGPDGKGGASITGGDTGAFQFVSQAKADTWLQGLDLTSHGLSVDAATISISNGIETLTASTTGLGAHEVFTLSLNEATGAWTFTLINPIDQQAGHGANSQTIDLSGLVQAVDFDGDTVTLSGDFSVSVKDDVPVLVSKASATGTVDEGGLTQVSSGFDHDHDRGTDLYGNGNDRGAPTAVSGTLFGLVSFGADGPDGKGGASITGGDTGAFQFVSQAKADTWLQGLDLTSHGLSVDAATISISNGIETLTASTTGLGAHEVFTLSLNEATGDWTFTLINPIDQQAGHGANSQTIDLSGLVQAVDFDGDTVTLSGDFSVSVKDDVPVLTGFVGDGDGFRSRPDLWDRLIWQRDASRPSGRSGLEDGFARQSCELWRRRSGRQGWCVDHWRRHGRVPVCIVIGGVVVADAS